MMIVLTLMVGLGVTFAPKLHDYVTDYAAVSFRKHVADYAGISMNDLEKALRAGKNVISVYGHQTRSGQFIDVGISRIVPPVETGEKVW